MCVPLSKILKNNDRDAFIDLLDERIAVKLPNQVLTFNKEALDMRELNDLFTNIQSIEPYLSYTIVKTDQSLYKIKGKHTITSIYGEPIHTIKRYRFDISYNGYEYAGMQRQTNARTIQGTIESALKEMFKETILITPASRTDAGVHAHHQVFHADLNLPYSPDKLRSLLNKYLPSTIVIKQITEVPQVFHARYDAQDKTYIYKLHHTLDPFKASTSNFTPPVDITLLNTRLTVFTGKHDFRHFCKHTDSDITIRTIKKAIAYKVGDDTVIEITGDGFLRYMVRMIIGYTLKHLNTDNDTFIKPLSDLSGTYPKYKASPTGLFLHHINYKKSD